MGRVPPLPLGGEGGDTARGSSSSSNTATGRGHRSGGGVRRWGEGAPRSSRKATVARGRRGERPPGGAQTARAPATGKAGKAGAAASPLSYLAASARARGRGELRDDGFFSFSDELGIRLPSLVIRFESENRGAAARAANRTRAAKRAQWRQKRAVYDRAQEQKRLSASLVGRYSYTAGGSSGGSGEAAVSLPPVRRAM